MISSVLLDCLFTGTGGHIAAGIRGTFPSSRLPEEEAGIQSCTEVRAQGSTSPETHPTSGLVM